MFLVLDDHDQPITTLTGELEEFTTLREADSVAVALTRTTKRLHRAVPIVIDLRDTEPEPAPADLRRLRLSRARHR